MRDWDRLIDSILAPLLERVGTSEYTLGSLWPDIAGVIDEAALDEFRRCPPELVPVFTKALAEVGRRQVIGRVAEEARMVPEPLFAPMLLAGAAIENPSCNRDFVEPCIRSHGRRRVMAFLVDLAMHGPPSTQPGAVAALYWSTRVLAWPGELPRDDDVSDLRAAFLSWAAAEFVRTSSVELQRELIYWMEAAKEVDRPLADAAYKVALRHDDDYIRHRGRSATR